MDKEVFSEKTLSLPMYSFPRSGVLATRLRNC